MSRQIGALWARTMKNGDRYYSGVLNDISGDIRIAVFKNDRKEKENYPDYKIVLSDEWKPKEESAAKPTDDSVKLEDIPFN